MLTNIKNENDKPATLLCNGYADQEPVRAGQDQPPLPLRERIVHDKMIVTQLKRKVELMEVWHEEQKKTTSNLRRQVGSSRLAIFFADLCENDLIFLRDLRA